MGNTTNGEPTKQMKNQEIKSNRNKKKEQERKTLQTNWKEKKQMKNQWTKYKIKNNHEKWMKNK